MVGFEPGLQLAGMPSSVAGGIRTCSVSDFTCRIPPCTNKRDKAFEVWRQTVLEKSYNFFTNLVLVKLNWFSLKSDTIMLFPENYVFFPLVGSGSAILLPTVKRQVKLKL